MAAFLEVLPSTTASNLDLAHYQDISGFLDKSGTNEECGIIHDTKILCTSPVARDIVLKKLGSVVDSARKEEGTQTFLVLKSLDAEDQVRIFERYKNWDAFETHQNMDVLKSFWLSSKDEVKSLEGRTYVPNLKGWLSRLS